MGYEKNEGRKLKEDY